MEPTIPITEQAATEQTEQNQTEHSPALQARFNELTATIKVKDEQNQALMNQVTELMRMVQTPNTQTVQPTQQTLPEGVDPNIAKFFGDLLESKISKITEQTQAMFGQLAQRQDEHDVNTKYSTLPPDVRKDVQSLYGHLRKKYGDANMDDAVRMVLGERSLKAMSTNDQRQQFNQTPGAVRMQGSLPQGQSNTTLVPPTQREDWDRLDWREQNKLIDEYTKKGGRLMG